MSKFGLSISELRESMLRMFQRFPLACAFACCLFMAISYMIVANEFRGVPIYYFTAGFLLSLMLALWAEEGPRPHLVLGVSVAAHVLLLVDAIHLWGVADSYFDMELFISRGAVYLALVLGIVFLSFYREPNDVPAWNFLRRLLIALLLSCIVGGIMSSGVTILLAGIGSLFNIHISDKVMAIAATLCSQLLPMLLFLSRIPADEAKHDASLVVTRFLSGTVRYLFTPLAICYLVVLYAYLARILFTFELPRGTITWLVTTMMAGILLIEFLLYPAMRHDTARNFERWVVRWFPLLALPLVVLMTVGICRRLSDYGITVSRLYVLTLNVWFYAVCLGLWFLRARRIHWIPLSFGALLLLTSAQPMNYCQVVKRSLSSNIESLLAQYPAQSLPMNELAFNQWLHTMPDDVRSDAYSHLAYLRNNYNGATEKWLGKEIYLSSRLYDDSEQRTMLADFDNHNSTIDLPQSYSHLKKINHTRYTEDSNLCLNDSILTLKVDGKDEEPLSFDINLEAVNRANDADLPPLQFPEKTVGYDVLLIVLRLNVSQEAETIDIKYSGYLFYK